MPAPKTAVTPIDSSSLSKREACEFLGKSVRTVVQYVSSGQLPVSYVNGQHGREARFARVDLERVKRDLETPVVRDIAAPAALVRAGDAIAPVIGSAVEQLVAALRPAVAPRPWLTLDEAAEYSGLPRAWLLSCARSAASIDEQTARYSLEASRVSRHPVNVVAVNVGTAKRASWRFNREALGRA